MDNEQRQNLTDILFKEAMIELKDIKKEIVTMNEKLSITIERQSVASDYLESLATRVEGCEGHIRKCPARQNFESKNLILKDVALLTSLFLSLYAIYSILK
jgi:hypothetical protein